MKKRFWTTFSHFIEHNKDQETFFDSPQVLFGKYFASDKIFSLGPKRSIARNFSKQKITSSHGDRSFWLTFLSSYQLWQMAENSLKTSKRFFYKYCGSYKSISSGIERLLRKQFFERISNLSGEEKNMAPFLSNHQVWQTSKKSL